MLNNNKLLLVFLSVISPIFVCFAQSRENGHDDQNPSIRILILDSHLDTPINIYKDGFDIGVRHVTGGKNSGDLDLPRMKDGGLDAAFFAVYLRQDTVCESGFAAAGQKADEILSTTRTAVLRYADLAELAFSPEEAFKIQKKGKRAVFLGMENGYPVGLDLSRIKSYFDRGIRYVTLCHSRHNQICDAAMDARPPKWNGLSPFGKKAIAEMNRLGMMIDLSHVSDSTFFQALRLTRLPVIASHSCCRVLCDEKRNLSDAMLKALVRNRGVVQINLCSFFLKKNKPDPEREKALDSLKAIYGEWSQIADPRALEAYETARGVVNRRFPEDKASVADLVDHIDHAVEIAGVDFVGIGSDFDGGAGLKDCRDVSEFPNITRELQKRGYSTEVLRKIWGGNFIRVFDANINQKSKIKN